MAEIIEEKKEEETAKAEVVETEVVEEPQIDYAKELAKLKVENEKLRKATTVASSDCAEWKRKFRATMSDKEREDAEKSEEIERLIASNNEYKNKERILNYKTKLIESGYDLDTATAMANALPDGINDDFFDQQKRFTEAIKIKAREEALSQQPRITSGVAPSPASEDEILMEKFRKAALGI